MRRLPGFDPIATMLLLAALLPAAASVAADPTLLTAGAYKLVALELIPHFEQQTGRKVVLSNNTAGGLVRRIEAGEAFDLVVLTPAGFLGETARAVLLSHGMETAKP